MFDDGQTAYSKGLTGVHTAVIILFDIVYDSQGVYIVNRHVTDVIDVVELIHLVFILQTVKHQYLLN